MKEKELEFKCIEDDIDDLYMIADVFADEMKNKLAQKVVKGYTGWDDYKHIKVLKNKLYQHTTSVLAGEPQEIDVANLAMFIWNLRTIKELEERKKDEQQMSVDEYMELPWENHYKITRIPANEGGGYCVCIAILGSYRCIGDGETIQEAIDNLRRVLKEIIIDYKEKGYHIPIPQTE